ncbi:MAG: hypothetical protein EOO77_41175 [Oxalobacteraceae bacterium]|nr:MAG: hypothetical protein EOO77_41175 [Oxalobacteraceae bacterium]
MATTPQLRFRSTGLLHLAADQEGVKCLSTVDGEAEVLIKGIDYYEDFVTAKRYANNSWGGLETSGGKAAAYADRVSARTNSHLWRWSPASGRSVLHLQPAVIAPALSVHGCPVSATIARKPPFCSPPEQPAQVLSHHLPKRPSNANCTKKQVGGSSMRSGTRFYSPLYARKIRNGKPRSAV